MTGHDAIGKFDRDSVISNVYTVIYHLLVDCFPIAAHSSHVLSLLLLL